MSNIRSLRTITKDDLKAHRSALDKIVDYRETFDSIYFWNSCFSQWFASGFKDSKGKKYNNAEQFMMYWKAILFKDYEMAEKILHSINPRNIKMYGRQIKNFNEKTWEEYREDIVTLGNIYKFRQNSIIRSVLCDNEKELVEASPEDKIWGIGLYKEDDRVLDKSTWNGLNLLGKCLMRARKIILDNNIKEQEFLENKILSL